MKLKSFCFSFFLILFSFTTISSQTFGTPEKIAEGFQFVEGPVWKDGALLFSDIPANKIYRWTESEGVSEFLSPSGNSNGLALDSDGNLLLAQHGLRQVSRLETDNSFTSLATEYNDRKLNSPNDMAIKSDGSIFFTDPPYGINSSQQELNFSGVYRLSTSGNLTLLDGTLYRPNGIAFSPDEKILYVGDAEARRIYAYDLVDDSTVANKRQFAFMNPSGYTDGMKVDPDGRLFSSGPIGIWVYEPDGTLIETIEVPGQTTNCGWGDEDGNTLYITSGDAVYRIRNTLVNVKDEKTGDNEPNEFRLMNNYPNPFNSYTRITFSLNKPGNVKINILDAAGRKVEKLINNNFGAGTFNTVWDAGSTSSGIYYIQLTSAAGQSVKKCVLLK